MKIVILTGAGISAESGIATFRDSDGLWKKYPIEDVASIDGWERNPQLMLDFYNAARNKIQEVEPNAAHNALAELENHYDVTILTTNVDNLHEKAGSTKVIHLHGDLSLCRDSEGYLYDYDSDLSLDEGLRPHVVWFGEGVLNFEEAEQECREADMFVAVGTTMSVFPVAGLIYSTPEKAPRVYIDPGEPSIYLQDPNLEVVQLKENATVGVPAFCKMVKELV